MVFAFVRERSERCASWRDLTARMAQQRCAVPRLRLPRVQAPAARGVGRGSASVRFRPKADILILRRSFRRGRSPGYTTGPSGPLIRCLDAMESELPLPDGAVEDADAVEVARIWVTRHDLLVSLNVGLYPPEVSAGETSAWGDILADTVKHLAKALSLHLTSIRLPSNWRSWPGASNRLDSTKIPSWAVSIATSDSRPRSRSSNGEHRARGKD